MKSPKLRAKDRAWRYFSTYIRTRDCLKTTGSPTEGICVTCNRRFPFSQLQAGHAIGGRNNAILFDEELVNAQCKGCNSYGNGKYADYTLWFIREYGVAKWKEKVNLSHQLAVDLDYDSIAELYKSKLKELTNGQ